MDYCFGAVARACANVFAGHQIEFFEDRNAGADACTAFLQEIGIY